MRKAGSHKAQGEGRGGEGRGGARHTPEMPQSGPQGTRACLRVRVPWKQQAILCPMKAMPWHCPGLQLLQVSVQPSPCPRGT